MKYSDTVRAEILGIIAENVTYSPQAKGIVIHGAVDKIIQVMQQYCESVVDAYSGKIEADCGHKITKERIKFYHKEVIAGILNKADLY